jgi:hypothetical protein
VYYRIVKATTTVAYIALLFLTWRFIDKEHYWKLALGCAGLSAAWLALTYLQMRHLLKTYFDVLSRLEFVIPATIGTCLAVLACLDTHFLALRIVSLIEIAAWLYLIMLYRHNREHYMKQGHGPVPFGTWISPPAELLRSGDLLLTSGRVAKNLRESVGHAELVIEMSDGTKKAFSSYMARGAVLNPLIDITSEAHLQGHYIALRIQPDLNQDQKKKAAEIALNMLAENESWCREMNEWKRKLINRLPLAQARREKIYALCRSTGYDWLGLFAGRLASRHWTCIGAALELYRRLGLKTNPYGTGLLGFGTTIFDPIMPVRFLSDPAFHLLTHEDRQSSIMTN